MDFACLGLRGVVFHVNGVRLVAIVKENLDTEIDDFKARAWPEADLFMDESKLM